MTLRLLAIAAFLVLANPARAQFVETFDAGPLAVDQAQARAGWAFRTGDGEATMAFAAKDGRGVVSVDARQDRRNIWWALIRRSVSAHIDAEELARPDRELRVEARVRASVAPRRVNLHFNHSRTADFHSQLMEYDLPDTGWHVISFTTRGFDAAPQDEVFVQMAMIDWGRDLFEVEIDYLRVTVVDPAAAGADLGNPLPYRPPLAPSDSFAAHVPAAEDAIVDAAYPWVNFRAWTETTDGDPAPALSVSGSQMIVLRFDLARFRGRRPAGWGVLELVTRSAQWAPTDLEEFGELRVVEILGGDAGWTRDAVTRDSLFAGAPEGQVLGQMITDVPPALARGGRTRIAVSPPVLERLISGRTRGLAIYAQGALGATFHSSRSPDPANRPTLHFTAR